MSLASLPAWVVLVLVALNAAALTVIRRRWPLRVAQAASVAVTTTVRMPGPLHGPSEDPDCYVPCRSAMTG